MFGGHGWGGENNTIFLAARKKPTENNYIFGSFFMAVESSTTFGGLS
jgi:hypothetical protein